MRHIVSSFAFFTFCLISTAFSVETPRVIAHRGLLRHAPENTLTSFRGCLSLGAGFEVDVQRAKDGSLVCIHDDTLNRTTNGRGRVAEQSLQQLKRLDAGSWFGTNFQDERIPTFLEVAQLINSSGQSSTLIAVDLKAPGIEADVIAVARQAGVLDRLLFIGSAIRDESVRMSLRNADSSAHVACLADNPAQLRSAVGDKNSDWVYFRYLPSRTETAKVMSAGKRSFIAGPTVAGHEPVNWRRAIYSQLDAVLTDYPLEQNLLHREVQKNASQHATSAKVDRVVKPLTYADPETVEIHENRLQDAVSLIRRSVDNDELRGVVLLVARRGRIVLHEAIGFRDAGRTVPMKKGSLFRMASNSKAVTAAGILALVQDGLVALDDPVSRYIPSFGSEPSKRMTIRQLLTHTSGLRIPTLFLDPLLNHEKSTKSQLIQEVTRFGPIGAQEPPGSSYSYNNAGYNTLAGIIESVTGSYAEHLRRTFYEPLGMDDSCNHESVADHARMSGVFRQADDGTWESTWKPGDAPDWPFPRGSGGMVSSAEDYATFCYMMLNHGVFDGRQLLDEELVLQATNPQIKHIPAAARYGFGWTVREANGTFSHSGSDGTMVWVDPKHELIGMVLTQTQTKLSPRNAFRDLVTQACFDSPEANSSDSQTQSEGFYKDIFMSSGVNLSSRKVLHAAESTGLAYEYYAGRHVARQNQIIAGTDDDTNGALLYPDGQPRFRMIYVNGGGATSHGKSLTRTGRNNLRQFYAQGGSYCGSCAGSFLSGRNVDAKTELRLGYLHIFPHNTLNTGLKKARVGHFIPADSPLLQYRQFGEDHHVPDIYHNNGNWLSLTDGPHLKDTTVLATYDNPNHKTHGGAAIWAYRKNEDTGRIVNIGCHPEGVDEGERLALTEACFLYALDGTGEVSSKGNLSNGMVRVMDKATTDNNPELTRIGDRQLHHFRFTVAPETPFVTITLQHQSEADLSIHVNSGSPAFRSNAQHSVRIKNDTDRLTTALTPGEWWVSVECATSVKSVMDANSGFYRYYGNTWILNGIPYSIRVEQANAEL